MGDVNSTGSREEERLSGTDRTIEELRSYMPPRTLVYLVVPNPHASPPMASSSSAASQTQSQPAAPYMPFAMPFYLAGPYPNSYAPPPTASSSSAVGQTQSQPAPTPSSPTSLAGFPGSPSQPQGQPPAPSYYLLVPVMTWEPPPAGNSSMLPPRPYPWHPVPPPAASLHQQQQRYHDPEPPPVSSTQPQPYAEPLPIPIAGSHGSSSQPQGQPPAPSNSSMAPPGLYQQQQLYHDPEPPPVSSTQSRGKLKKVLEKYVNFDGKDWMCKFCHQCWSNSHSNRIIAHLARTAGKGIKRCPKMSPGMIEDLKNELDDCHRGRKKNRKATSVGCPRDQEEERAYVSPSVGHSNPPPIGNSLLHDMGGMGTDDLITDFMNIMLNPSEEINLDMISRVSFGTSGDSDVLKFVVMDFCIKHNIDGNEKNSLKDLWTGTISDLRFYAILIAYFLISRKGRCRSVVYVAAEVLELAGNAARDSKKKRIVLLHILSHLLPKKFWC